MADIPFRKILGLNQQTYQRLRLSLTLHLRRQVFVAVCDDLTLRDRMSNQLAQDLNPPTSSLSQPYPRLVTLQLNLNDPNPMAQIAQWVAECPPPKRGNRRAPIPTFQFVGIEHLTRQSAAVQRLFFAHLQAIERHLTMLESGLLIWLPKPWFHALPQSAPEFWQCRTGMFEFIGDPTPTLNGIEYDTGSHAVDAEDRPRSPDPQPTVATDVTSLDDSFDIEELEPEIETAVDDLWTILTHDLSRLDESNGAPSIHEESNVPPELDAELQRVATSAVGATATVGRAGASVLVKTRPVTAVSHGKPSNGHSNPRPSNGSGATGYGGNGKGQPDRGTHTTKTDTTKPTAAPSQAVAAQSQTTAQSVNSTQLKTEEQSADAAVDSSRQATAPQRPPAAPSPAVLPVAAATDDRSASLLQQIELLHQQHAPPSAYADAYRNLGNYYRDRIEAGDTSLQNLQVAIHSYEQVLVWLHETSPLWTDVLNDLGNLYWMLSRSIAQPDQALSYLQQSIQAYQLALAKITPETPDHAYPMLQNNLGSAYADLARHQNPVENLQRAIQAYQQTLHYRRPETAPLKYASTQNNLGTAYWSLAQHQQPEVYLKQAIAAYSEALTYYTAESEPLSYAMIQNNLGTAFWNLAQHERPVDWLRLAVTAYRKALQYRTLEESPAAYAATQNNLGTAYLHMANHSKDNPTIRSEYWHQTINAYEAALMAAEELALRSQSMLLNFDLYATHNNLGLARYQVATDTLMPVSADLQQPYLEVALHHHVQAYDGWQHKPDLQKTAFSCMLQTIRALYQHCGLEGQNVALSKVPAHLLSDILVQL